MELEKVQRRATEIIQRGNGAAAMPGETTTVRALWLGEEKAEGPCDRGL